MLDFRRACPGGNSAVCPAPKTPAFAEGNDVPRPRAGVTTGVAQVRAVMACAVQVRAATICAAFGQVVATCAARASRSRFAPHVRGR